MSTVCQQLCEELCSQFPAQTIPSHFAHTLRSLSTSRPAHLHPSEYPARTLCRQPISRPAHPIHPHPPHPASTKHPRAAPHPPRTIPPKRIPSPCITLSTNLMLSPPHTPPPTKPSQHKTPPPNPTLSPHNTTSPSPTLIPHNTTSPMARPTRSPHYTHKQPQPQTYTTHFHAAALPGRTKYPNSPQHQSSLTQITPIIPTSSPYVAHPHNTTPFLRNPLKRSFPNKSMWDQDWMQCSALFVTNRKAQKILRIEAKGSSRKGVASLLITCSVW